DVVALSHQNRGLHSISDVSNRQKYHEFQLGREGQESFTVQLQAGQNMLLEILANPSLGGYYRRLVLYGSETGSGFPPYESEPDIYRLKQALKKAGVEKVQDRESILSILWQDPLYFRSPSYPKAIEFRDALIMMLAANAPNLESLSMYPLEFPQNMLKPLLQRASKVVPGLGTIYVEDPYYNRLNVVRKLPAIESVAFRLASWDNNAGLPLPPHCANYSKISFIHSLMQEHDLCRIIESLKTLKSFTFTVDGRKDPEGGITILSVAPLLQSLWFHRYTLEVLDLDMESCTNWQEFYDTNYQLDENEGLDEDEQKFYKE
ncbi:uncharacterized protein N7518_000670, partial [Penicillium psychrosexuale]|uniref:uncharacterized protein n=1 Tax=Penicillium psychrosexuale TaxID=1002107 RepID=UPI002545B000